MKVYIGDLYTDRSQKQEMPMLGGFLNVETFEIGNRDRTSSNKMISRITTTKRRFIFEFLNMLPEHFYAWTSEQKSLKWREMEFEEEDKSFTKVIVEFKKDIFHTKMKTNLRWVYGQVVFTLEEV